ncbi:MAG: SpoIVB peptidase [Lachnospiraceae bacterium]|nr:SpoIVB peptidase [Lachnospiraceae bacterium]
MNGEKRNSYRALLFLLLIFVLSIINIAFKNYYIDKNYDSGRIDVADVSMANADNVYKGNTIDISNMSVMPSGLPIGIYVKTEGVMVVDTGVVTGIDGELYSPCKNILFTGDYVVDINGEKIDDKKSLVEAIDKSDGRPVRVGIIRNGVNMSFDIVPVKNTEGRYKLGLWVKDDISGIGTLTYVDAASFGALGHSINDNDTGIIFEISDGAIYNTSLINIVKPEDNNPGRLEGIIDYSSENVIGRVTDNTEYGISGYLTQNADYSKLGTEWMNIAPKEEVNIGPAYIISQIRGTTEYYEVNITKLNYDRTYGNKSIELEITDPRLINLTDGIVQGMSGTPIIQNNRLVGAITHVFLNDSTKGYGIFIEYMLEKND